MCFGRSPFETFREGVSRLSILNGKYTFPVGNCMRGTSFSDGCIKLIQKMLQVNAKDRPFMDSVITICEDLL